VSGKVIGGFAAFVDRKSHAAAAAELPPYSTELERPLDGMLSIGSPWTERLFDGPFYLSPLPQRLPACHLVFVQSLDGNTGARNPQTLGGGETDKHVIYEGLTRVLADAVLAGSSTVRGGSVVFSVWHPEFVRLRQALGQPRHPVQIVATRNGVPIDRELLYNIPELRLVLLTRPPESWLCAKRSPSVAGSRQLSSTSTPVIRWSTLSNRCERWALKGSRRLADEFWPPN
jgi:riboflavin biosynthesis pyrimidine reductase